jgi:hypothetical protein
LLLLLLSLLSLLLLNGRERSQLKKCQSSREDEEQKPKSNGEKAKKEQTQTTKRAAHLVEQPFPVLDAAKRVDQRARQLAPSIGKVVLHVREVRLPIERRDGCVSRTVLSSSVPMFRRLEARRLFLHSFGLLLLLFNGR